MATNSVPTSGCISASASSSLSGAAANGEEQQLNSLASWFRATDNGKKDGQKRAGGPTTGRSPPQKRGRLGASTSLCQPWNSDQFAERVRTYSLRRWLGKPLALSPLQCARHGWVCSTSDADKLCCPSCSALVQISFAPEIEGDEEAMRGVCAKFIPKLNDAHKPLCAWRDNACPDSFTQVCARVCVCVAPLPRVRDFSRSLALLHASHTPHSSPHLCSLSLSHISRALQLVWQTPDVMRAAFGVRVSDARAKDGEAAFAGITVACAQPRLVESADARAWAYAERSAVEKVALLGWRFISASESEFRSSSSGTGSIHCGMCQRTVRLASYARSSSSSNIGSGASSSSSSSASSEATPLPTLDPEAEHRCWCPWVAAAPRFDGAIGEPTAPGWELLLGHLCCSDGVDGASTAAGATRTSTEQYLRLKQILSSSTM